MTAPVGGHGRFYRGLLRLYPADYRARFADQMVQLFGDQVRDDGKARSWLKAMVDIPGSALSEHLRRNRSVAHSLTLAPTPAARLLGLLGVLGGAFLLLGFIQLDAWTPDLFNLRLLVFNLGAIAIAIGVHMRQSKAGRLLSLSGAIPVVVANAVYLVFTLMLVAKLGQLGAGDYQPVLLFFLSAAAMWLSDAWFGLVTFRLRVLNRWSALALVIGSLAAFVGMGNFGLAPNGSAMEKIVLTGVALHGAAWILLGLEVALRRRPAPTASA
ncbi:MAG TPA: hypothetical protein VM284_05960 [Candidatus Limnocylindria bacterium]|nr:hypothetical protein [Candidatus Limnocylindria bacterium]